MSFDTTKTNLKELLADAHSGKLQLPEFQRDYVWNEGDVRSLIESIAKGFPVGALLTLERGGSIEFKPREVEGTSVEGVEPEQLLLDGQQRMTSLYKTIYSKEPRTKPVMIDTAPPEGYADDDGLTVDEEEALEEAA